MRAIVSVTPPGAYGTTTFTVRVGHGCARHVDVAPASITPAATAAIDRRSNVTAFPSRLGTRMVERKTSPIHASVFRDTQ